MTWTLSIDFGTSSTIAVGSRPDGSRELIEIDGERRMPSVAFLDDDETWVVGRSAVDLAAARPDRAVHVPKRRLGDQTPVVVAGRPFNATAICAEILRVAASQASRQMGSEPDLVRLTYPAMWNRPRRTRLLEAAQLAGLATPVLIPEPVAAAHALPFEVATGSYAAIYDLGGGTFDTTVVRSTETGFEVVGRPTGDAAFGGELFDEIIRNHIGEQLDPDSWDELQVSDELQWRRSSIRLLAECKRVKEAMSSHPYGVVIASLPNGVTELRITREQLDELVEPFVDESVEVLDRGITQAGLSASDLEVIHLVGGASRMPIVADRVRAAFPGVRVEQLGDPRTAAALGAALAEPGDSQIQTIDPAAGAASPTNAATPPTPPPAQPVRPGQPAVAPAASATHVPAQSPPAAAQAPATQAQPAYQPQPVQPQAQPVPAQPAPGSGGGSGRGVKLGVLAAGAVVVVFGIGAAAGVFADRNSERIGEEVADRTDSLSGSTTSGQSTSTTVASTTSSTSTTTTSSTTSTTQAPDGPTPEDIELLQLRDSDFVGDWSEITEEPLPLPTCDIGISPSLVIESDYSGWSVPSTDAGGDAIEFKIESTVQVYRNEQAARAEMRREQAISRTCDSQEGLVGVDGTDFSVTILTLDDDNFIIGDKGQETFTIGRVYRNNDDVEFTYIIGNRTQVGRTVLTIWARSPSPLTDANLDIFSEIAFRMVQRMTALPD